jgi:hypothetical protein
VGIPQSVPPSFPREHFELWQVASTCLLLLGMLRHGLPGLALDCFPLIW